MFHIFKPSELQNMQNEPRQDFLSTCEWANLDHFNHMTSLENIWSPIGGPETSLEYLYNKSSSHFSWKVEPSILTSNIFFFFSFIFSLSISCNC